jgi:hypothetical protein
LGKVSLGELVTDERLILKLSLRNRSKDVNWSHLVHDKGQWREQADTVMKQERQCMYTATLRRVRVATVAVQNQ